MTETDEQRKTRLLISYAWQLVRNAQQRIDDLSADSQDDLYEYHDQERAQLQQWLEFATQAAEELERLQADKAIVDELEALLALSQVRPADCVIHLPKAGDTLRSTMAQREADRGSD